MGMNQPSPEQIQQLMGQQYQSPMGEIPPMDEGMNALADSMLPEEVDVPFDPMMLIEEVITEYAQFALRTAKRDDLDAPVQSQILLQQAQALSTLVPLLKDDSQVELMKAEQELELKREEMDMNMQMKQAELEMKQQEHSMKLQFSQEENQLKLQQQQENHQNNLVQSQESHQTKIEQQKQAAQLKQSSNSGSNQPKK